MSWFLCTVLRQWSGFILLHVAVQFSQHHLLKRLSFSLYSGHICCKLIEHICIDLFLGSLLFLDSLLCSAGLCVWFYANTILFWLLYFCDVFWNQDVDHDASSFVPFSQDCFSCSGSLFHMNFRIVCSCEECHWNFERLHWICIFHWVIWTF